MKQNEKTVTQNRPTLRGYPWVILALLVAPIAALVAYVLIMAFTTMSAMPTSRSQFGILFFVFVIALIVAYAVELIVVVPAIILANRFKPSLLTFRSAVLIGSAIGGILPIGVEAANDVRECGDYVWRHGDHLEADCKINLHRWLEAATLAPRSGFIGAMAAAIFQVIAVRRQASDNDRQQP